MELQLKLTDKNHFPLSGILIKGTGVEVWLNQIQYMGFSLDQVKAFPIPGSMPNSVWGCLLQFVESKHSIEVGKNSFCQCISGLLYIPETTVLFPQVSNEELEKILGGKKHLFHPEIGMASLEDEVDWKQVVEIKASLIKTVERPLPPIYIPKQIKSFQINPIDLDELLEQMDGKLFPKSEVFKEEPLSPLEKIKLLVYKQLFTKKGGAGKNDLSSIERKPLLSYLDKVREFFSRKNDQWTDKLQLDFEDLERRSQKHLDRLLELLKKNPEEALRYAIPLDPDGTSRGREFGSYSMNKRWFDFSLFGSNRNTGGHTAIMSGDTFIQLHTQYINTAQELIKQKDFRKAAYVYMKLLKNYLLAAQALEQGGYYSEAASVYLKHNNNKSKAAECFEKAKMTEAAIELYKELNQDEKVGDLYYSLHKRKEAFFHYQKVADEYEQGLQCVKAAMLYKHKMENVEAAQKVLLKGWHSNKDAFNCLNNYLSNIRDEKQLWMEVQELYTGTNSYNKETFLRVLQYEYAKENNLAEGIKDMAYEIIAELVKSNPSIVSELKAFNKKDKELIKDALRFKVNWKSHDS